jgi:hypothetical protein
MRDRYVADAVTLARIFPNNDYETQSDCAIETRRNLETATHEINGLLAMSDVPLMALTRKK